MIPLPDSTPAAESAPLEPPASLEDLIARATPAVVRVETATSFGSGFFVAPDTILTNVHVVSDNPVVTIRRADNTSVQARVDARAPDYDVAVLKVASSNRSSLFLPMGSGTRARPGQEVIAMGSPLGLQNTVTRGIVSALRLTGPVVLVQTDAAINPGNSGGPLLNRSGQVVGIATMSVRPGSGTGLSFAVAIDHAQALMAGRLDTRSSTTPVEGLRQAMADARTPSSPSSSSSGPSDADRRREQGAQVYKQTLAQLARLADALDTRWTSFMKACYSGTTAGTFDRPWFAVFDQHAMRGVVAPGCRSSFEDIRANADRIRTEVLAAEEAARRADVYPGTRREEQRRNRLDYAGWDR
jgi:hypothetical protein